MEVNVETTGFRAGGTVLDVERLSPALLARVDVALRTGEVEGERPSEETLRVLCSDCTADGLIGSGYHAVACRHRMGWLAFVASREGITCLVRKPAEMAVA